MLKFYRISSVFLLISCMALIFCLSHQPADASTETSGGIIEAVLSLFYRDFFELSAAERAAIAAPYQFIVRKAAHFTLYAILGSFAFLSLVTYERPSLLWRTVISLIISLAYAVSDEIHQLFIVGRSCELRDVCIDFAGSLSAIAVIYLITRIIKSEKTKIRVRKLRKKELFQLNDELFKRLDNANHALEEVKAENEELRAKLERLKAENEELTKKTTPTEPLRALEQKLKKQAEVSSDTEYGAAVIGKIVVSAAKHCNTLTATKNAIEAKELVNLILGRTEVAKAEILNTVTSELEPQEKKAQIDSLQQSAEDYFESVMAQIK